MHRRPLKPFAAAVLLLALVAAEALATVHSLDFDAHSGGEPCNVCISVAGLGTGVPAKAVLPDAARSHLPVPTAQTFSLPALRIERPSARAPPLVS